MVRLGPRSSLGSATGCSILDTLDLNLCVLKLLCQPVYPTCGAIVIQCHHYPIA